MIKEKQGYFFLTTENTSYIFRVMPSGHLEHIHYGPRVSLGGEADPQGELAPFVEKREFLPSNTVAYSKEYPALTLENTCLEMSSHGKGDIREPFIEITYDDNSTTSDFLFKSFEINEGKAPIEGLPSAYADEGEAAQLIVCLKESCREVYLYLVYTVFSGLDTICRSARLENREEKGIYVSRLMSAQLDFDEKGYDFISFNGAWAREMDKSRQSCISGKHINSSFTGGSSSRANPFVIIAEKSCCEDYGSCWGSNLVYSGNHYECLEVNSFGRSRFVCGMNPAGFGWRLEAGESLQAPEAVLCYSSAGFSQLSLNMHAFVRRHIVRGQWQYKERPVLLNSWEASYFKFNESSLLKLARAGKEAGIELFVMDDGWFGERNDDTSSLGDWTVNSKKLPGGIKGIADKINAMGMDFGIWVEPEMVNENSQCYRNHPEWAVQIPGRPHSEGRSQMILDLSQKPVRDYIIASMREVFSAGNISYVKWDMNRILSDIYSPLGKEHSQQGFCHRYILGLYEILDCLTGEFPHILFEGCAAGGNRFDLGILCYMPQFWASDNSDALCRASIQSGYSYAYPPSVVGAHVSSCPNHQTLRNTPLASRFNIACFGLLGYECNLAELPREEREAIKEQIALYKKWRGVFQFGDFYRLKDTGGISEDNPSGAYHWLCVAQDKSRAVAMTFQSRLIPNTGYEKLRLKGLSPDKKYRFYNIPQRVDIKAFGDLINMLSPIHIKSNSIVHDVVAKIIKMEGEAEDYTAGGNAFNSMAIKLKPAYIGTGFNENTRLYPDFASRMYFLEEA